MDPITAGLVGTLGSSLLGGLFSLFGGSGRSTQDNAPALPPVPEWKGMQRGSALANVGPQLRDPGSAQQAQDPGIRIAALDELRRKMGV